MMFLILSNCDKTHNLLIRPSYGVFLIASESVDAKSKTSSLSLSCRKRCLAFEELCCHDFDITYWLIISICSRDLLQPMTLGATKDLS